MTARRIFIKKVISPNFAGYILAGLTGLLKLEQR